MEIQCHITGICEPYPPPPPIIYPSGRKYKDLYKCIHIASFEFIENANVYRLNFKIIKTVDKIECVGFAWNKSMNWIVL